jgi:hypothetical protein
MSDASKIQQSDAQAIYDDNDYEAEGTVTVGGEDFDWWTDGKKYVWFYQPLSAGEDTIRRFETHDELLEVFA